MNVLFVMNAFVCAGAEKLVMDLSRGLAGHCAYVGIAALYRSDDPMQDTLRAQLEAQGIHTYILDKRAGKDRISTVGKLRRIIREQKVDLIHGHCSVPMLMGKLAGQVTGIPAVSTVHSTKGYSLKREKLSGWMCRAYVSIGAAAQAYMTEDLQIPREKITRIYNAVDTARFMPADKRPGFWKQWGLDDRLPVIACVGRVVELKNQMCLLRALKRCAEQGKPMQGVILGMYDETSELYRQMQDYLASNGLTERVRFMGQRNDVADFLVNSDCFVMPSRYEGLSVSFLEAVFCRIPVVVTDMPFVRELNEISPCATVIPQDDDEALSRVLLEGSYQAPPDQTLEIFRDHFSMDTFVGRHLALYRRILGEG